MTIKMQSLKRHPWDGGFKLAGDEFDVVDELQAKTVEALGWGSRLKESAKAAERETKVEVAEESAQAVESAPAEPKQKRKYTRRDMRAE